MNTSTSHRLDYIDAVRALALLLGIIFHASLAYLPMFIGWAVMDISTSAIVSWFVLISHSFRMELFFLVAGFFSHMSYHQKGFKKFLHSRLLRIALPFTIFWFALRPMLISGWIMGSQSMRGEVDIWQGAVDGFNNFLAMENGLFVGTHLWFLYYLLLITTVVLIIRTICTFNLKLKSVLSIALDRVINQISTSPAFIFVLAIPITATLWFMSHWGVDTPDKSLLPNIPVTLLYMGFFSLGWLLRRLPDALNKLAKLTRSKSIIAVVSIVLAIYLSKFETQSGHMQYELFELTFKYCYAVMMCSLVFITIGLCKRLLNQPSKPIRYLADASYWLYLIHLPIVVWLQIAFAELPLPWFLKLMLVSGITITLSLILYDILVRNTVVGYMLNGKKKQALVPL